MFRLHRRRSPRASRRVTAALALAMVLPCTAAGAQGLVRIHAGTGEIAGEFRRDQRGYGGAPGAREASYREWLRLPISGSLPSPQLFSYSLVFRPVIGQQRGSGLARHLTSKGTGLDLSISALQSRRGGLNLFATQHEGSADGGLGGESFYATRARGATIRLATRFLPVTIDANERRTNDMWRGAFDDAPFERSERLRTLRFVAAGTKTAIHAERIRFRDRKGVTSFDGSNVTAEHRLRWGRGSSLESTLEFADRVGYDPFNRRAWSERLQLQHSRTFATNWRVQRRSSLTYGVPSAGGSAGVGLRTDLTRALSASVQADRSSARFPAGSSVTSGVSPRVTYRRQLKPGTWVNASASTAFEDVRRDIAAGDYAEVEEERHRVERSRIMQLERVNVDAGSIIVRSADLTRVYRSPEDYRVISLGSVVRLQFPASSPVAAGDIIVATYRYLLLQRTPYQLITTGADFSIATGALNLRHSVTGRDLLSGGESPVAIPEQGTDDATTLALAHQFAIGHVSLELERRRRARSIADFAVREARFLFVPPQRRTMTASFGATASQTTTIGRAIGVVSGNAALGWAPSSTFRVQTSLDTWAWRLTDAPTEQFTGLTMFVAWSLGQLETEWRYGYQLREQVTRGVEHRMWARVVRRF